MSYFSYFHGFSPHPNHYDGFYSFLNEEKNMKTVLLLPIIFHLLALVVLVTVKFLNFWTPETLL